MQEPIEKQLWKAANTLRKNIDAAEYKHVVLGLIFLKYISEAFEELRQKLRSGEGEYADTDPEDRDEYNGSHVFYIGMCTQARWSVRTLRERIESLLFERTAISKKPDDLIQNELELLQNNQPMTPHLFLKDPCLLDFLDLKDNFTEKDLENAILMELERFVLELGSDFAFMGRQKRIQIGGDDYYIDLLFFHRKLKRLVLIELKVGDFDPDYKGQVELYLKWLAKYEQQPDEHPPIAIILCSGKDADVVELMDLEPDNIHIAEYWLQLPPKEVLQAKLHKAMVDAKARITFRRDGDG